MTTTKIGSGRPQFILPNNRFDQITLQPLALIGVNETKSETSNEQASPVSQARNIRRQHVRG
jgi:hypothetical protein